MPARDRRILLEKVADSARKAVKLAKLYKPYGGQFPDLCSISLSTYQTCMKPEKVPNSVNFSAGRIRRTLMPAHLMFTACLLNSETNLSQPAIYVQCTCTCTCTCRCLRRVFGHDQYTSIDFILTKYILYTFSRRVNLKLFVFVFRCLSRCTSHLLSTIFTPLPPPPPPPLCIMPHKINAATRGQASDALNLPRATLYMYMYVSLRSECYFIFGSRQMEHASTWMSSS